MNSFLKKIMEFKPIIFMDQLLFRIDEDRVMATGAQLTFSLILSIFPFIIVFLNILTYTPLVRIEVLNELIFYLPLETQKIITDFTLEIAKTSSQGLLSIAAILGLWTSSSGIQAVIKAINRAYDFKEKRSFVRLRIISLLFTIALMILMTLVFLTLVFGELLTNKIFLIIESDFLIGLWEYLRLTIPLLYMVLIFALLYRFSPCKNKNHKISIISTLPGAIFTTLGWLTISTLFSYYVNNFGRYAITYGSLVGIILLLIWLYISSIIIVVGGEINATIEYFKFFGFKWVENKSIVSKILGNSN